MSQNITVAHNPELVIQSLRKRAGTIVEKNLRVDCCIAATAIAIDVLQRYGIEAEPIPVSATVANRQAVELLSKEGVTEQELIDGGAKIVEIDTESKRAGYYAGHLVAAVRMKIRNANVVLIDLSARQFHRPKYGIYMDAMALLSDRFLEDGMEIWDMPNGAVLRYQRIENERWKDTSDWKSVDLRKIMVDAVVNAMQVDGLVL